MAGFWPPGFPYPYYTPPPPRWALSPPPPPPPPFHQTSPRVNSPSSPGGVIAGVAISIGAFLLVLTFVCSLCQGYRNSRANATSEAAAAAAVAALAARRRTPPPPVAWDDNENDAEQRLRSSRSTRNDGRPRRASPAAGLPSFTYNRSVRHNVAGGGGEEGAAASCSVCLGAFQAGEIVRLLPVCLHLYHVECIDPWLDAHSTCPICRSGTDPGMDGSLFPPV
ncbi:unnamed protein product [Urochloa humidicola]